MQFDIDYKILKALNTLASKKDVRYYLNGVNVEITPNGAYFVATDGHKMGVYFDDKITSNETITRVIPSDLIIQTGKGIDKVMQLITITLAPMIEIKNLHNTFKAPAIDGVYPNFRKVIPESINHEIAQFNPDYLSEFKKCAQILSGVKEPEVSIGHNGHSGSVISIDDAHFLGVMMPYRTNTDFTAWAQPLWVDFDRKEPLKAVA